MRSTFRRILLSFKAHLRQLQLTLTRRDTVPLESFVISVNLHSITHALLHLPLFLIDYVYSDKLRLPQFHSVRTRFIDVKLRGGGSQWIKTTAIFFHVLMWKAVKSTALINNVDGISAIPVKTVFEAGAVAIGPAASIFLPAPPSAADLAMTP